MVKEMYKFCTWLLKDLKQNPTLHTWSRRELLIYQKLMSDLRVLNFETVQIFKFYSISNV